MLITFNFTTHTINKNILSYLRVVCQKILSPSHITTFFPFYAVTFTRKASVEAVLFHELSTPQDGPGEAARSGVGAHSFNRS